MTERAETLVDELITDMIRIKSPLTQAVDVAKAWAFPTVGCGPLERSNLRRMTREIISAYLEAAAAEIKITAVNRRIN